MKLYLFIINFFILIVFSSNNLSAGNQPFCNGNFSYNHENFKNTYKIEYIKVNVLKNKKATIKNSSGKILEYKIFLDTTIEVSDSLTDDNLFKKKFISSTTYKVQDQYYDTVKLENRSIENLVNKTYEEIFIKLSEAFLKNDN